MSLLARPYARAVLACAVAADSLAQWSKQLALMSMVVQIDVMQRALRVPSLTAQQQAHLLLDVCRGELTPQAEQLVHLLAENKRLLLLPVITKLYERYKANREKRVTVDVATAFALEDSTQQALAEALRKSLQREVILQTTIDQQLLGGVKIRAADQVIDGSIRGRLIRLGEAMRA